MLPYLPPSLEYYYWPKVGGAAGETKTTLNNDYKAKLQNLFIALKNVPYVLLSFFVF